MNNQASGTWLRQRVLLWSTLFSYTTLNLLRKLWQEAWSPLCRGLCFADEWCESSEWFSVCFWWLLTISSSLSTYYIFFIENLDNRIRNECNSQNHSTLWIFYSLGYAPFHSWGKLDIQKNLSAIFIPHTFYIHNSKFLQLALLIRRIPFIWLTSGDNTVRLVPIVLISETTQW